MLKLLRALVLSTIASFFSAGFGSASAATIALTGSDGQVVSLPEPPRRVISLLPSWTEAVCLLDRCDHLIGVDRYSNWPSTLKSLPALGGGFDPDIEGILALKPDLILTGAASKANERLRALGLTVLMIDAQTNEDVHRALEMLARVFGLPDQIAEQRWLQIEDEISQAAKLIPPSQRNLRVYFEVSAEPYAAAPDSFLGQTLSRLGLRNIIPTGLGSFPKINPELVVKESPDVIMMSEGNLVNLSARPGWSTLNAVKNQHICLFAKDIANVIVRPGPRMAEGARAIVDCLTKQVSSGLNAAEVTQ